MNKLNRPQENASSKKIYAVIPAAGLSRRMGTPKQLLTVNHQPMLIEIAHTLASADISGLVIVTNSNIRSYIDNQLPAEIITLINDDPNTEMIDSIRLGLTYWQERVLLKSTDGFLICPGDVPGLRTDDINMCIDVYRSKNSPLVCAAHQNRRGHPLIFSAPLIDEVHSSACDTGLRNLLGSHANSILLVELNNPAATRNINTPNDYQSLQNPA